MMGAEIPPMRKIGESEAEYLSRLTEWGMRTRSRYLLVLIVGALFVVFMIVLLFLKK